MCQNLIEEMTWIVLNTINDILYLRRINNTKLSASKSTPPNVFLRSIAVSADLSETTRSQRADPLLLNLQRWWELKSLNVFPSPLSLPDLKRNSLAMRRSRFLHFVSSYALDHRIRKSTSPSRVVVAIDL